MNFLLPGMLTLLSPPLIGSTLSLWLLEHAKACHLTPITGSSLALEAPTVPPTVTYTSERAYHEFLLF